MSFFTTTVPIWRNARRDADACGAADGLPADAYGMLEMYCNEPGCDCRRVFFMVVAKRYREPLAYVAYGWESRKFYAPLDALGCSERHRNTAGADSEPCQPAVEDTRRRCCV